MIYIGASSNNTIRHNLAYETSDKAHRTFNESEYAFAYDAESWRNSRCFGGGGNQWIGNMAAGTRRGFYFGCAEAHDGDGHNDGVIDA